jgi:hypothetical protein
MSYRRRPRDDPSRLFRVFTLTVLGPKEAEMRASQSFSPLLPAQHLHCPLASVQSHPCILLEGNNVREFYSTLALPVRVGIEPKHSTPNSRRLMTLQLPPGPIGVNWSQNGSIARETCLSPPAIPLWHFFGVFHFALRHSVSAGSMLETSSFRNGFAQRRITNSLSLRFLTAQSQSRLNRFQ